jgi:hypothetical protein
MIFEKLLDQLHDEQPKARVMALRVLAMVEETRALNAIALIYSNDPDPRVQSVAKWAGGAIHHAQQCGHSTEVALQEHFATMRQNQLEDLLVRATAFEVTDHQKNTGEIVQDWQYRLEYLSVVSKKQQAAELEGQVMKALPSGNSVDDLDLLDMGVSHLFEEAG